jgi:GntR family transcriptional repressor for pyruvate dehydrogenase complex
MTFQLRPVDRARLSTSIAEQILEGIKSAAFAPGQALPAERELASQLGVSRGSVREAVRVLEYAGVLEVRTGHGTFVVADALSKPTSLRVLAVSIGEQSPLDVIVARQALEPTCARLAAEHRHESDRLELRAHYDEQASMVARNLDPTDPDIAFHRTVARASRNQTLEALVNQIVSVLDQKMWREYKNTSLLTPGKPEQYLAEHREILDAVEAGDSARAARAMDAHLHAVEQGLLSIAS